MEGPAGIQLSVLFYQFRQIYHIYPVRVVDIYVGGLLINKIDDGCSMARKALPKESKKEYKALIGWQKKCVCVCVVLVNVGILVFLKYSVFLGQVFTDVLGLIHINVENPMYQRMSRLESRSTHCLR